MSLVWGIDLPDSEKLVLLALADSANDEGHCWPSMKTLAKKCSKTDRTVQASIKSLVANGHLTRTENPGKGCFYTVHPVLSHGMNGYHPPQFHYVYRVTDEETGEFYVGARSCLTEPVDDPYLGSGEWSKAAKARGAALSKEIVQTYPSREALGVGEAEHTRAVFGQALCRNRKIATPASLTKQFTPETTSDLTPEVVSPRRDCPPKRTTQTPEAVSDKPSRTIISSVAKATSQRATRIPPDWKPGPLPAKVSALVAQWPPGREERELDGFRDYWTARNRDAARTNWDLTWHNRIRDQHDRILRENRNGNMGRHQSANGISATISAAIDVFGFPDACDEGRVPCRADEVPRLGGPGQHG